MLARIVCQSTGSNPFVVTWLLGSAMGQRHTAQQLDVIRHQTCILCKEDLTNVLIRMLPNACILRMRYISWYSSLRMILIGHRPLLFPFAKHSTYPCTVMT